MLSVDGENRIDQTPASLIEERQANTVSTVPPIRPLRGKIDRTKPCYWLIEQGKMMQAAEEMRLTQKLGKKGIKSGALVHP